MSNPEIVGFIQDAAIKRGINPWVACAVASTEGGLDEYAMHGDFETGDSWWAFQLHYGGAGYWYLGTVAGMGNGFTALTGWQPGDERAWRDATRYSLNRAKRSGWSAWYGAQAIGLIGFEGIDRSIAWDANLEVWDFEKGHTLPDTSMVKYDPDYPAIAQNDPWSCGPTSLRWALKSVGRNPTEQWIESTMIAENVANPDLGVTHGDGSGIAAFVTEQYGEFGFSAVSEYPASFDDVLGMATGRYPLLIGGQNWGHWSGLRYGWDFSLHLANPSEGWKGVGQNMTRDQFEALGPFSCVRILHDDLVTP